MDDEIKVWVKSNKTHVIASDFSVGELADKASISLVIAELELIKLHLLDVLDSESDFEISGGE